MLDKEIIENAKAITVHVKIEKCDFNGTQYKLDINGLNPRLKTIMTEVNEQFQQKVRSGMRFSDTPSAVQDSIDVFTFAKRLLESDIPDKLKIALFSEMNIVGYMFDRSKESYIACTGHLDVFLDTIEKYKKSLTQIKLKRWNNSTYAGDDMVPFFRGYLQGVNATSD
ncbi:MAG: hypothetical protein ISR69_15065 [Gammaproteobacteria bacterium]|nr:hypothetical protein [Gammaproteobacteria bacterium]